MPSSKKLVLVGVKALPIKRHSGIKGKCDTLFSKIIRSSGACERCGSDRYLQTSHIISRQYSVTRCDLKNAQNLCSACHFYFTHWPKEFSRWITESIGVEAYEELKAKALTLKKMDWNEVYTGLETYAKTIGVL